MATQEQLDQIETGPTNWEGRLQPKIELVSPITGTVFLAFWKGSPRTIDKKVGIFDFPLVNGTAVQDLGTKGARYSLNFFFEGPNNDIESARFFDAIAQEKGLWAIEHPVHGFLGLQPTTITTVDNPTESGNITEIQGDWIEPIDEFTLQTARQLFGLVDATTDLYNSLATEQYNDETSTDTFAEKQATADAIEQATTDATQVLEEFINANDAIAARVTAAQTEIANELAEEDIDTEVLTGPAQAIIQSPALGSTNIEDSLAAYDDLADAMIARLPSDSASSESKNRAVAIELSLDSVIAGAAQSVTLGEIPTRAAAYQYAEAVLDLFQKISSALETVQKDFDNNAIDSQYFPQTQTRATASELTAAAVNYLLVSSFDSRIERRFTLVSPSTSGMIVLDQYGDDERLQEFIDSNELKNLDILYLGAGREVVVYV
jgi:hypothetical protein